MECSFDRAAEDLGNIVALEHVNVTVPDQQMATTFYVSGLGLTRDPYLMTSGANMWINAGRTQFHLPTRSPQVVRGRVGLVVPNLDALVTRLGRVAKHLKGTRFECQEHDGYVDAVCPWGNRIRAYEPHERFGPITLGIAYVEFDVPPGTADGIARFYREAMGAAAFSEDSSHLRRARVSAGIGQDLIFQETKSELPPYDGHHVQIYVADFSGPHRRLREGSLITEESDQHQYRFQDIVDPEDNRVLFTIEHEVRSMRHPMFMRPLVNRDTAQSNMHYGQGRDAWNWAAKPD